LHPADIVLVVAAGLAEASGAEQDCDEVEVGFLIVGVLLE
jgi:hypothetical protein